MLFSWNVFSQGIQFETGSWKEVLQKAKQENKLIFVDLYTTWCGPCIQESPAFAALSEKYKDKDIVFIQLSTDNSRKTWLSYLKQKESVVPQFNSVDNEGLRVNWQIKYIPRFILIDKEFNIVESFAPRPSDPEITEHLDALISKSNCRIFFRQLLFSG